MSANGSVRESDSRAERLVAEGHSTRRWVSSSELNHGRGGGTLGNAFLEVQAIIEPSKRYVLEERLEDEHETQESGDPPDAGEKGRPTTG